jgi:hypothetical protein
MLRQAHAGVLQNGAGMPLDSFEADQTSRAHVADDCGALTLSNRNLETRAEQPSETSRLPGSRHRQSPDDHVEQAIPSLGCVMVTEQHYLGRPTR